MADSILLPAIRERSDAQPRGLPYDEASNLRILPVRLDTQSVRLKDYSSATGHNLAQSFLDISNTVANLNDDR